MDAPTERIGYALKNFFKEAYFLSESSEYLLKENSAQGQSELTLTFTTDNVRNLCIEDVDGKKQRHKGEFDTFNGHGRSASFAVRS